MAISGISFEITEIQPEQYYTQPQYESFFVFGYANILYPFPKGFNYEAINPSEQLALSAFILSYQLWNFDKQLGTESFQFAQINQKIALNWVKENNELIFSQDTTFKNESGEIPPAYLFPFIGFNKDLKLEGVGLALYLDKQFQNDISNVMLATKTGSSTLIVKRGYRNSNTAYNTALMGLDKIKFTKESTWGNGFTIPLSWTEINNEQTISGFQYFSWGDGLQSFTLGWTSRGNSDLEGEITFTDTEISNSGISQFFDTASGAFEAVSSVLSTQLIPGLSVGTLIAIPLCFSVVLFLIKVVKGD